jgi:hypothetical protein
VFALLTGRVELVETNSCGQSAIQRTEDERDEDEDRKRPPGKTRVTSVVSYNNADRSLMHHVSDQLTY